MKILSIGASSSSSSINQQLADYAAHQVDSAEVTSYPLHQLSLPIYSEDEEKENGIPDTAKQFSEAIRNHDGIIVSLAEHNGSYTAAFKNLYDWTSRIDQNVWQGKTMLLLSTSPGPRGGATVLAAAEATFPRMGAELTGSYSLPSFYGNFTTDGITDETVASELQQRIQAFSQSF